MTGKSDDRAAAAANAAAAAGAEAAAAKATGTDAVDANAAVAAPAPGAAVDCLAPHPALDAACYTLPPLACDTHAHVIGAGPAYPMVSGRSYTPPPASLDAYLAMLAAQGMQRGVLVQVSVHGTDNRYLVEALRAHPQGLRGVAVVDPQVSDRQLQDLHEAGVRGLRINVLFGGGVGFDAMESLARRIATMGWHLQFLADAGRFDASLLARLERLPCPGVIDHMGYIAASAGIASPGFLALARLVQEAGFWVKLSGAYRLSRADPDFADVTAMARRLIELAPDRTLWGSDWPHVDLQRMPNTGRLRNALAAWAPDADSRRRILVDNPARLYGFAAGAPGLPA